MISNSQLEQRLANLERRLPLGFVSATGSAQPTPDKEQVIFWEDTGPENTAKILMRRGARIYVFESTSDPGTGPFVRTDGSQPLTADWDAGNQEIRSRTFESDVPTGTAPFVVASTTVVTNLNADLLDGLNATGFIKADGTVALTGNWNAGAFNILARGFDRDAAGTLIIGGSNATALTFTPATLNLPGTTVTVNIGTGTGDVTLTEDFTTSGVFNVVSRVWTSSHSTPKTMTLTLTDSGVSFVASHSLIIGTSSGNTTFGTDAGNTNIFAAGGNIQFDVDDTREIVVNEQSRDADFRVEGATDTHLIFVDGTNDRVGISTSSPATLFDVDGNCRAQQLLADGDTGGTASTTTIPHSTTAISGATPATLGNTGGGPAAAAQSHWLKYYDGTTARYIPVWT